MQSLRRTLVVAAALAAPQLLTAQASGIRKEFVAQMSRAEQNLVALANAVPQDKLGWRPPGVRSFTEVFMHVIIENLDIPPLFGAAKSTISLPANAEKSVTTKAQVVDLLTKSFAYAKQAVAAVPDAQLNDMASYFGTPMTKRGIMLELSGHGLEHMGQLVAYARMNGIKPPWSQ
jgi:uncharacterized damage-inducible protein DinB